MYVVYDILSDLFQNAKDNLHQLNIVAVYTRLLQGAVSEAASFALCAIRVDHDVAHHLFPPSIPFLFGLDGAGRANPKREEPWHNQRSSWYILAASRGHAFLAAISCYYSLPDRKSVV